MGASVATPASAGVLAGKVVHHPVASEVPPSILLTERPRAACRADVSRARSRSAKAGRSLSELEGLGHKQYELTRKVNDELIYDAMNNNLERKSPVGRSRSPSI